MIWAINYGDNNFQKAKKLNKKTALKIGKADRVISYGPEDIDDYFKQKNNKILSQKRGGGFWLWKPYFILKTLSLMEEEDFLFYCDAGAYYVNSISHLVNFMKKNKIELLTFELPLIEKQWTKEETFISMECNKKKYRESNQILATYFLVKKSNKTFKFFQEFLNYAENEELLTDILKKDLKRDNQFIDHRHDQSIFSLLCKKHNIKPFRDPSQYGEFWWKYCMGKRFLCKPKRYNSDYPRIIVSYRKANPNLYYRAKLLACDFLTQKIIKKSGDIKLLNELRKQGLKKYLIKNFLGVFYE